MFVPVNCTACGKPFQVPEAVLGQSTACPWCKATVTALPVAAPVPAADPVAPKPRRRLIAVQSEVGDAHEQLGGVERHDASRADSPASTPSLRVSPAFRK